MEGLDMNITANTPIGTKVRRAYDGLIGTLVRLDAEHQHGYVDLGRHPMPGLEDDVWAGSFEAWEIVGAVVATVGTGRSTHFAYYVADRLTGTYCDRAAWESKRVRPHFTMTADQVTCSRCQKVAASDAGAPNQRTTAGVR